MKSVSDGWPELGPDGLRELARAGLPVGEHLEDAPSHGVTEDVECVHEDSVSSLRYITQA